MSIEIAEGQTDRQTYIEKTNTSIRTSDSASFIASSGDFFKGKSSMCTFSKKSATSLLTTRCSRYNREITTDVIRHTLWCYISRVKRKVANNCCLFVRLFVWLFLLFYFFYFCWWCCCFSELCNFQYLFQLLTTWTDNSNRCSLCPGKRA